MHFGLTCDACWRHHCVDLVHVYMSRYFLSVSVPVYLISSRYEFVALWFKTVVLISRILVIFPELAFLNV